MSYGVDIGSSALIYVPSFKKLGSDIQDLIGGAQVSHADTNIKVRIFIFRSKESRLKTWNRTHFSVGNVQDSFSGGSKFSSFIPANADRITLLPRLGQDRLLPNPSQMISLPTVQLS
jgi:hypothetical protein